MSFYNKCLIFFKNSSVIFLMLFQSLAHADRGGWAMSGGEIFKFDRNPWFVAKNTPTAKYCFLIDKATLSISEDDVRKSFQEALAWWKEELANSTMPANNSKPGMGSGTFTTGPEQFIEDCTNPDLELKIGYGSLTKEEIEKMQGPNQNPAINHVLSFIGVSVRKEYDLKLLKGKGFIFIASDLGPNAYKNSGELIEKAWTNPKFMTYAFMHELGHVFGFTHMGVGLMSEIFLDQLLNKRMAPFYEKKPLMNFLRMGKEFEICNFSGNFNSTFLLIKESAACLVVRKTTDTEWKVYKKTYIDSNEEEVGTLVARSSSLSKSAGMTPGVLLQLPDEQTVFTSLEKGFAAFLVGPIFQEQQWSGYYVEKSSPRQYPVSIHIKPNDFTVIGTVSNQLLPVIVYSPPTLLRMLFPIP